MLRSKRRFWRPHSLLSSNNPYASSISSKPPMTTASVLLNEFPRVFGAMKLWSQAEGSEQCTRAEKEIEGDMRILKEYLVAVYAFILSRIQEIENFCFGEYMDRNVSLPPTCRWAFQPPPHPPHDRPLSSAQVFHFQIRSRERDIRNFWIRFHGAVNATSLSQTFPAFWEKVPKDLWPLHVYSPAKDVINFGLELTRELMRRWKVDVKLEG
ncbi:hypothetical protein BT69DRAFT_833469 [Atractiella rhizophila]|nr:hypothetical protein BT69DRAFT_833469 [Atractiella rhizophila]